MENTTNINDLPIEPDYPMPQVQMDPRQHQMDPRQHQMEPRQIEEEPRKKVRFTVPEKSLLEKHRVLLLAVLFFLLFSDTKVKIYLMNILVVIFGDALRTTGGASTKLGQVFYTALFGLTLWLGTTLVEWRM